MFWLNLPPVKSTSYKCHTGHTGRRAVLLCRYKWTDNPTAHTKWRTQATYPIFPDILLYCWLIRHCSSFDTTPIFVVVCYKPLGKFRNVRFIYRNREPRKPLMMNKLGKVIQMSRSQWPRGLRRRSTAACLLRSWVRIPPRAWMFVCCGCCVLSGRGLCDGLIIRSEESYRLWRVVVCDHETSQARRLKPARGL